MTGYDDEMIEAQAYGPDDDRPADDDMPLEHDPAAERMAAYLDTQDAAADWMPGGDGCELDEAGQVGPLSWQLYFIRAAARRGDVIPLTPEEWAAYEPPF